MAGKKWRSQWVVVADRSYGKVYYDGFGFSPDRSQAMLYPGEDEAEWRANEEKRTEPTAHQEAYLQ